MRTLDDLQKVWREAIAAHRVYATPVSWARANRIMGEPFPGPYDCSPYLIEPQESGGRIDPCEVLVWLGGSQVGKTTAVQNILGHMITQHPGPALWVVPKDKTVERTRAKKLKPFVAGTPALASRVGKAGESRRGRDNAVLLSYPGGELTLAGSTGKDTYRQDEALLVILDDADAFGRHPEGDHLELAKSRVRTYRSTGGKVLVVSRPGLSTTSITLAAYKASSQGIYEVPCLECGGMFVLWREYFRYRDDGKRACFECPHCNRAIYEESKDEMVKLGHWSHRRPERVWSSKGYHFWAAYAPSRFRRWDDMAAALRAANAKEQTGDQIHKQTVLAEDWAWAFTPASEKRLDAYEQRVWDRREPPFQRARIRYHAITAGTDVQGNRLEISIWLWGYGAEGWLERVIVIEGSPANGSTWQRWREILIEEDVSCTCVDAKYKPDYVVRYVTDHMPVLLRAGIAAYVTMGVESPGNLWPKPLDPGNPTHGRVTPVNIHVNTGKDWVYGSLHDVEKPGPNYLHLDTKVTRAQLMQLFAERLIATSGRKTKYEKRPGRTRNELLDTTVLAKAALDARCMWDLRMAQAIYGVPIQSEPEPEMAEDDWMSGGVF